MSTRKYPLLGAVMAFIPLCLSTLTAHAQSAKTYIHPNAPALVSTIDHELYNYFTDIPQPWYVMGLIEHESCQHLRHPRCLSATSSFVTTWKNGNRREQGAGLGMLTRAWTEKGTQRMDTLTSLRKAYPNELHELTWENITTKPELQVRAIVLLLHSDYERLGVFHDPIERLKASDSAYNGGRRDVLAAMKNCGLTKGCDPQFWFGHVEKHCVKSKVPMYSGRSACDINTHHVQDVFNTRMPKYQPLLPKVTIPE